MSKLIVNTIEAQTYKYDSDTTGMTIDNAGRIVTEDVRPAFKAYYNANNWALSTGDVFVFDRTEFNVGSCYDTSNGKFTAPRDGIYHFNYYTIYTGNAGNDWISLQKNGSRIRGGDLHFSTTPGGNWDTIGSSTLLQLSSGDEITMVAGTAHTYHGGNWSEFSGFFVG